MKKRKNIIISAITCMMSICLMMFGVYSATNPSVSINGQVSYTARDASVLVQGKTNNDETQITFSKTAPANKTALLALSKTLDGINTSADGDTMAEYFDWTQGEKSGNSADVYETLSSWDIGNIPFKEDNTGVKQIKLKFLFANYSNYPVKATLTFDKSLSEMSTANVQRTSDETDKVITKTLGVVGSEDASTTVEITYAVIDDSKSVNTEGLLGMNIVFEKTATTIQSTGYTLSSTERSSGTLTMGKKSESSTAEDVQWKCFAYSTDGTTWTQLAAGTAIPETAKYCYFILGTTVSGLNNQAYLKSENFTSTQPTIDTSSQIKIHESNAPMPSEDDGTEGWHNDLSGLVVQANDYYYSDVRKVLKNNLKTILDISSDNAIYKAIKGRTIKDLYTVAGSTLPTGAVETEEDLFWLEGGEITGSLYSFAYIFNYCWTRSQGSTSGAIQGTEVGEMSVLDVTRTDVGILPAFMLELA